jgi:hypothetical protein
MTCSITILSDLSQHHFSGRNRYLPFLLLFPFKRLPGPVVYLVGVKDSPFHYKCMITTKEVYHTFARIATARPRPTPTPEEPLPCISW